jgi:hypothetical protein
MSEAIREFQVLGDFLHTGSQAAGTIWRPKPVEGNAELDTDEVAEVLTLEIVPPVTAADVEEDLRYINLILDGKLFGTLYIPGMRSYLVTPPLNLVENGDFLGFGQPVWNANGNALLARCPKFKQSVTVECYAGGAITADYRIRVLGYRYEAKELSRITGPIGLADTLFDPVTGRMSEFINKPAIQPARDTWTQLPGGLDQAVPKIFPFVRMAFNAKATTPNLAYEFRFDVGNVAERYEDLYFPYDMEKEKKIAIINGLGVRAPANLKQTWMDVGGDERPKSRIPTSQYLNPIHFGKTAPLYDSPKYITIPLLRDRIAIFNEKAVVKCVDDGTSIPANSIAVIANGVLVELT